ncbi:hypothetical protein cypCar_00022635, partial [Cyprinus carpio]
LQELFAGLLKALLKCLSDPAETCRDAAIQILAGFIRAAPRPEDALPYLMPALAQRLGGKEILEPAEELRLALMETLSLVLEVCGRQLAPYLDDMIKILQRTITDPFPEVKKESCKCAISVAQSIPEVSGKLILDKDFGFGLLVVMVRKAVTIVVGDWLLRLPDRYSYFHKLIPLLLSSLSDEIPEI